MTPIEMVQADIAEVLEFWHDMPGVGMNESDTVEQLTRFLKRNQGLSLVVRDGHIVAAVLCGHDGRRGYMHHLAVAKEYRGRGIGTKLVETCLRKLHEIGIMKCNIFVYDDNDVGNDFWRSIGWLDRVDLKVMQRVIERRRG